jgi:curli biogenesis system outer membrane secretion channel CsgG
MLPAALGALGCGNGQYGLGPSHQYVKPTIAAVTFESRAAFPLRWNLGDGMRDILVDRLVATGRFHVVERPELDAVLRELKLQNSGVTRRQRRAELGRLKNASYLVKATITDFGHVSTRRSFLGLGGLSAFGGSNRAVMGLTLYVVDVESGQIVCSESIEKSVGAGDLTVKAEYKDVVLGGSTFYRTPLGRATAKVIDEAVGHVVRSIAARRWAPKIAKIRPDGTVVLNGGRRRHVEVGQEYLVVEAPEPVVDPETGDVIGHVPGQPVGRLRVTQVRPGYSVARVLEGRVEQFEVGQLCRPTASVASR